MKRLRRLMSLLSGVIRCQMGVTLGLTGIADVDAAIPESSTNG